LKFLLTYREPTFDKESSTIKWKDKTEFVEGGTTIENALQQGRELLEGKTLVIPCKLIGISE
jgi:hypothetical protein